MEHAGTGDGSADLSMFDTEPPRPWRGRTLLWLAPALAALVLLGTVWLATPPEPDPAQQAGSAGNGCSGQVCVRLFELRGDDGRLPTDAQLRTGLEAENRPLLFIWRRGASPGPLVIPAGRAYDSYAVFGACAGGGRMAVTVDSDEGFRATLPIRCGGVVGPGFYFPPNGLAGAAKDTPIGPYPISMSYEGTVTDAVVAVFGSFPQPPSPSPSGQRLDL
ncbi:hypothetical protein [Catellatospora coxensis]|uniref:Uncharacterized protein n=1 Tax=Catellatospora coxensis TaxID=310354 RepID=A0A8J3KYT2_9ACTN|nr:hypothetical protein [Catellatospora coxensis]GIG07949.1 hypothetical protein Cco03nite_46490 [Catellatospora coxensis]